MADCGPAQRIRLNDAPARPAARPDTELIDLLVTRHPELTDHDVRAAMNACSPVPGFRQRMAWAVLDRPDLLTCSGAEAPVPSVLSFLDALVEGGATSVIRPACPSCGTVRALEATLNGQRMCSQHRNTALFSLAAELPAAVLARMLGVHIDVAVRWQRASAGDWNAYAADVAARPVRPDS